MRPNGQLYLDAAMTAAIWTLYAAASLAIAFAAYLELTQ